jgi:phytoene desaturase
MSRVVVVGAGMGGLAAAARLAAAGMTVTLLESGPAVGGKLAGYRRDGFVFDTGPSLLTLPAVLRDLYLKTGEPLDRSLDLRPVDPAFHYVFADGTSLELPNSSRRGAAEAMQRAFGARAAQQWAALVARGGDIWELTRERFLANPRNDVRTVARLARRPSEVRTIAPGRSLRDMARHYLDDPRQQQVVERYATYTGSDPRRAPAALLTIPYIEQTFGAWHVTGGLHRIAESLHSRLAALGVDIRLDTRVSGVLTTNGTATGVRLADGSAVAADVVVSDVDAWQLYSDLIDTEHHSELREAAAVRRRLRATDRSLAGFVMLLAVAAADNPTSHHTVLFTEDYDAEFDAIFGMGRPAAPPEDPTVYICSPHDRTMHPEGAEAWSVLVNVPPHGSSAPGRAAVDWDRPGMAESYRDLVLATMARRGLDVADRVLWCEVRTPADLERQTLSPGGSIYGTASHGALAPTSRPAVVSPVANLYVLGGSAHPGGGLPMVTMGAETGAELVLARHGG